MVDHILVASDMSARSDRALQRAAQLAKQHHCALTAVHIVDDDLPGPVAWAYESSAKDALEMALKKHGLGGAPVKVETGATVPALLDIATRTSADLVVVGQHKPRFFWDILSGTTVERFIRATHVPVLLVADPVTHPYRSVLCGVDLSRSCVAAGNMAVELAPDARFAAFHAVHVPYAEKLSLDDEVGQIAPFVADAKVRLDAWWPTSGMSDRMAYPEIAPHAVSRAFAKAQRSTKADLFALGAHGRSALAPTMLGSFAETLIREPVCDLLIVRR